MPLRRRVPVPTVSPPGDSARKPRENTVCCDPIGDAGCGVGIADDDDNGEALDVAGGGMMESRPGPRRRVYCPPYSFR
jgi:hypothetical protein